MENICLDIFDSIVILLFNSNPFELEHIGKLAQCSKKLSELSQREILWEKLYRSNLKFVPHLDLYFTWIESYKETTSLLMKTSKELVEKYCAIEPKFLNRTCLINTVNMLLLKCMAIQMEIDEDDFIDLTYDITHTIFGVKLTAKFNNHFEYEKERDEIHCILKELLKKFGYIFN